MHFSLVFLLGQLLYWQLLVMQYSALYNTLCWTQLYCIIVLFTFIVMIIVSNFFTLIIIDNQCNVKIQCFLFYLWTVTVLQGANCPLVQNACVTFQQCGWGDSKALKLVWEPPSQHKRRYLDVLKNPQSCSPQIVPDIYLMMYVSQEIQQRDTIWLMYQISQDTAIRFSKLYNFNVVLYL